ncbi:MAG: aspartate/glutamate racemase family protein, partial [Bacteroidota bacterium]
MQLLTSRTGTIGVFDSGIGGLSVANAISGLLPRESLLYVADNARAPYGPQSPAAILGHSREITAALLAAGAKMIVVACNTATALAIDTLREEFLGVPFVGMEPAIKPAASGKRIGVMATRATLDSARYGSLKERFLA